MGRAFTPDICFIGGASSLAPAIVSAARSGYSVALVLPEGGDGTRARLVRAMGWRAAARDVWAVQRGAMPAREFTEAAARIRRAAAISPNSAAERLQALGVRVFTGEARFTDRRTLFAGEVPLRARHTVIATGSRAAPPEFAGRDLAGALTEDSIGALTELPRHLVVLGAAASAVEIAQAWRRLGSAVTLVATGPLVAGFDPEMAALVMRGLAIDGVTVLQDAKVNEIHRHENAGFRIELLSAGGRIEGIEASHLLIAGPRIPNLGDLALDKAGVRLDGGRIAVSATLRTSNPRICAVGDVAGEPYLAHHVAHQAEMILAGIRSGRPARQDPALLPRLLLADPELAELGLTAEQAATGTSRATTIVRWPYAENDRALAEGRTAGHMKLVLDKAGMVLGASIVGANAGELIGLWTLAVARRLSLRDIAGLPLAVSTFGEIGKRAAIAYFPDEPRRSLARKLAGLLRVFG